MPFPSIFQFGRTGEIIQHEVKARLDEALYALDTILSEQKERKVTPYDIRLLWRVVKALKILVTEVPEPSKENTFLDNSHRLLNLRDRFLACEKPRGGRYKLFRVLFNLAIIIYDFDYYYTERGDWLMRELKEIPWDFPSEPPRKEWWEEKGE